jgi:predicted nucleotidyltransferase
MIKINTWLNHFLKNLEDVFGERVWFVGLQGSYGRGEATEKSDIDLVVILDKLYPADIRSYDKMLNTLQHRELICGFFSGRQELLNWDVSDLFQLYHDTTPIQGNLDSLLEHIDGAAVDRAIKIGACNIYHGCVHNMLHEKSSQILLNLYKTASFVVQAIYFKQHGKYIKRRKDLLDASHERERDIINIFTMLKNKEDIDLNQASEMLFLWSQYWINI